MKSYKAAILMALFSFTVVGQDNPTSADSNSSFWIGLVASQVFFNSEEPKFYRFENNPDSYYTDRYSQTLKKNESSFHYSQLSAKFHLNRYYFLAGIGIGVERINLELENYQSADYYNTSTNYSTFEQSTRTVFIDEKHTSLIGSIEFGRRFIDKKFKLSLGLGLDVQGYFQPLILRNELIKEEDNKYYSPTNGGIHNESESTHDNLSQEWNNVVKPRKKPLITPKITLTTSYAISKKISVSARVQMRLLTNPLIENRKGKLEFPIGIGCHYYI